MTSVPKDRREKELWRHQRRLIRDILWDHWEPIGMKHMPGAPRDEYDGYIGRVAFLLREGAPSTQIVEYLHWAVTERMLLKDRTDYSFLMARLAELKLGD